MTNVVISIGANCGNRHSSVSWAVEWLGRLLGDFRQSEIYETPCALKEGRPYMNAVVKGIFQGIGYDLEEKLKEKEKEMGRNSECRQRGEVPIDIDIVVCDGAIWKPWDFRQRFFTIGYSQLS